METKKITHSHSCGQYKIWMVSIWIRAPSSFIHINLSPTSACGFFRLFVRAWVSICEYMLNIAKLWLPSHKYHSYCSPFYIDIRTVELFSRQSIFIMSIAIYCSIGTFDRETISDIQSESRCLCVYAIVLAHFFFSRASVDTVLHINVQNHKRNELRSALCYLRVYCVCIDMVLWDQADANTKKNVHWYIGTHTYNNINSW